MVASLLLGGDVMLGRNVGEKIEQMGPDYPLGGVAHIVERADLAIVNLECAITSSRDRWSGAPKAFYFGAPPEAVDTLLQAGVDMVSLANNHVLDFGCDGLEETLGRLEGVGIVHAGAGKNDTEAARPVCAERKGIGFGMMAYCDHQDDFAAGPETPGINYIDLSEEQAALDRFREDLRKMGEVDWPILSLHWGPNMIHRPSGSFVRLARGAIDMGYGMVYGHSAHVFHGVGFHKGCPIFYACGDLVDDYHVDPEFRNDCQLIFELQVSRTHLERLSFHPVLIENCRAMDAAGAHRRFVIERMEALCREMGTEVRRGRIPEIIVPGA